MNHFQNFSFTVRRRLIALAWFCLVSSLSLAIPLPRCPARCECSASDGGLRKATCTEPQWNGIAYSGIRVLVLRPSDVHIECNVPEDLPLLFPQLNSISLRGCSLTDVPTDAFRRCKSLQVVDLSHNSVTKLSGSLFADNPKLRYVNLENNPLDLNSHPVLRSDSVWEMNLARCNLSGRLPPSMFAALPNLRYLSLADNRLETIPENSLPGGLKRLDLSGNSIVNIPLSELYRLNGLKEIDVSRNPVDCTCQLKGFQHWASGEGTVFRNQIRCATPNQYAGYSLVNVPQSRLCDVEHDQQLISNRIRSEESDEWFNKHLDNDDDLDSDNFLFDVEIERVVGEQSGHRHRRRSVSQLVKTSKTDIEGSGSGEEEVEGSGNYGITDSADEAKITTIGLSKSKNETIPFSVPSANPSANLTEASIASEPKSEIESSTLLTISSHTTESSISPPSTVKDDNASESANLSKAITPDPDIATSQKEPESTETTSAGNVDEITVIPPSIVTSDSMSGGLPSSERGHESGLSESAATFSSEVASSNKSEHLIAEVTSAAYTVSTDPPPNSTDITEITSPVNTVFPELIKDTSLGDTVFTEQPNSSYKADDPATTQRDIAKNDLQTESLITSQTMIIQEEQKGKHPDGLGNISEESDITTVLINADDSVSAMVGDSEKKDDNSLNSTGQPIQDQMTKNETVENATSASYIIPSLLIVAVALVCAAVYFSQHNCKPKSWNRNEAKANGPATELQDVSLLEPEVRQPSIYSKRYEAEGQNPQTEKLTNGNCDLPAEEDGSLLASQLLANDQVPPVKKSTTRVTTNYDSLPKMPIIIQKS